LSWTGKRSLARAFTVLAGASTFGRDKFRVQRYGFVTDRAAVIVRRHVDVEIHDLAFLDIEGDRLATGEVGH
jgi:hypothetical protein